MTAARWIVIGLAIVGVGVMAVLFTGMNRPPADTIADSMTAETALPAPETTANGGGAEAEASPGEAPAASDADMIASEMATDLDLSGVLPIEVVIDHAEHLVGVEIIVRGTILTQCIVGCRFAISDDTGVINVELEDDALENTLVQGSVGRIVEVRGVILESSPAKLIVRDPTAWEYAD